METFPPPPESVVRRLQPFIDWFLSALDDGLEHANDYEERTGYLHDAQLFAYLVRNYVRNDLHRIGDDAPLAMSTRDLPLCGLEAYNDEFRVRILKAAYKLNHESGEREMVVPGAHDSRARQDYFEQRPLDLGDLQLEDVRRHLKLVLIWDCNRDGRVTAVSLALTRRWNAAENRVSLWWRVPLYPSIGDIDLGGDMGDADLDEGEFESLADFDLPPNAEDQESAESS